MQHILYFQSSCGFTPDITIPETPDYSDKDAKAIEPTKPSNSKQQPGQKAKGKIRFTKQSYRPELFHSATPVPSQSNNQVRKLLTILSLISTTAVQVPCPGNMKT